MLMMRNERRAAMAIVVTLLSEMALAAEGPVRTKVAIKAGKIITISGDDIEDGIVLIEDGVITDVGTGLEPPWDANVIDASEKVVMPGFVDAHTSGSMRTANEQVLEVPFLSAADAIDPVSSFMEDSLRDGVTTMLALPGNDTLLGGTGVVVKPHGMTVEDMLVRDYTGLKISLQARRDSSRMAHLAGLRKYLADLERYVADYEQRKADAKEAKKPFDEEIDPKKQPMIDLDEGRLTAFVYCPRASDVVKAFELSEEHELTMVPVLGPDCYKAAGLLAEKGLPVILDAQLVVWETDEVTETEEMHVVPKIMADAGVKFAVQRKVSSYGSRYLWLQAAQAVAHGVDRTEALKSVTLYPAEIIGLGDKIGSVDKGKDANLLILTGDPLDAQTWVDQVLIEGEVVYTRAEDKRLKRLLEERKPEEPDEEPEEEAEEEEKESEEPTEPKP
jgi:imidazolonepropionase-like amidohydrolase